MPPEDVVEEQLTDVEDHPEETQSQQSLKDDEDEQLEASPSGSRQSTPSEAPVEDEESDQEVCVRTNRIPSSC